MALKKFEIHCSRKVNAGVKELCSVSLAVPHFQLHIA